MPPLAAPEEKKREYFRRTRESLEFLQKQAEQFAAEPPRVLSIGTTHDFKLAIAEGSTLVRIGTAIFGERRV